MKMLTIMVPVVQWVDPKGKKRWSVFGVEDTDVQGEEQRNQVMHDLMFDVDADGGKILKQFWHRFQVAEPKEEVRDGGDSRDE